MRKEKRMEGGMEEKGRGGEGEDAHLYSSVDCRVSAVVVQLLGKRWASCMKIMSLDLSLYFIIYHEYD